MAAYYDDKQKTWYVKFRYTDWQGNSKSTSKRGFRTKKEALQYEADTKNKLKEKPQITLRQLVDDFLKDYKLRNKASSYSVANNNCKKYILPLMGHIQLDKLKPLTIRKWQNELLEFELASSTLASINTTLNTVLNFAVKYYGLASNPFKIVGNQGKYVRRLDFLELSEFQAMEKAIDNIYAKTAINILFWTGMRMGELMALTKDDIDIEKKTISINKQLSKLREITTPKTKSSIRTITIPDFLAELIKEYYKSMYDIPQYIFAMYYDTKIHRSLKKACETAGVKVIFPHALRHSHASFLIKQGVPITSIAKRLGHSNPSITMSIYAHCYKGQDKDIADMIEKIAK